MSSLKEEPSRCSACDSENIEFWDQFASWVCTECSLVLDETGPTVEKNVVATNSGTEPGDGSTGRPWDDSLGISDASDQNLVDVLSAAETISSELSLPTDIEMRAAEILTKAWESNFMHGRTKVDTIAAALYAATRENEQAVPPGVLADAIETDKGSVKTTYRKLKIDLELNLRPPTPREYVWYLCQCLDLPSEVQVTAENVLNDAGHLGGNPIGIAAAGIHVVTSRSSIDITLRELAAVTTLTKETVWRHSSKIRGKED